MEEKQNKTIELEMAIEMSLILNIWPTNSSSKCYTQWWRVSFAMQKQIQWRNNCKTIIEVDKQKKKRQEREKLKA